MSWLYKNEAEQGQLLLYLINGILAFQVFVAIFYILYCLSLSFDTSKDVNKKDGKKGKQVKDKLVRGLSVFYS